MGADYLEQDVVATSDDELVVMHDIHLDRVTNVTTLFAGRERSDGRYYVRDFTLVEIKQLSVNERLKADGSPVYPGRSIPSDEVLRVQTFAEELDFIARLQSGDGRSVGIYPEIKRPAWHRQEGVEITPLFLDVLRIFGYDSHSDPVYVQCFDATELVHIREDHKCDLKLIQLIADNAWGEADTDYDSMRSRDGLSRLAETVDGVGPWINQLYDLGTDDLPLDSGLVSDAHDMGLAVHPFTFRGDDLPPGFQTFAELISYTVDELCIDGLFTDFPDLVLAQISR